MSRISKEHSQIIFKNKKLEWAFYNRGYPEGQKTYEKVLSLFSDQGSKNYNHNELLSPTRMITMLVKIWSNRKYTVSDVLT